MQATGERKSVELRCTCGNKRLEWAEPLTPASLLRCGECEHVFVFAELVNRMSLEAYDPESALTTDSVAGELIRRDIHVAGVRVIGGETVTFD
ncbi:MAG: hypothetical protein H0T51_14660 [Pirellulales bacterium]|nr:hypothetical protein [Pirellulales bacterium]